MLLSPELTLRRLSDHLGEDRFPKVLAQIARAMGLSGDKPRIEFGRGGGVTISADEVGEQIPLEALADGYRVTFNCDEHDRRLDRAGSRNKQYAGLARAVLADKAAFGF